jgi:hypothetical protein
MITTLLDLYKVIKKGKNLFNKHHLNSYFFIDVYRSQPLEPELYEYFSLPAIFVDYQMVGQGKNKPRLITLILHVVTDEMPDASNISLNKDTGLKRFLYHTILQKILEGTVLAKGTPLKFVSENIIDAPVINYHTQTYEFESYLENLEGTPKDIELGMIELLKLQGNLVQKI